VRDLLFNGVGRTDIALALKRPYRLVWCWLTENVE
jgi:hypothetical protein